MDATLSDAIDAMSSSLRQMHDSGTFEAAETGEEALVELGVVDAVEAGGLDALLPLARTVGACLSPAPLLTTVLSELCGVGGAAVAIQTGFDIVGLDGIQTSRYVLYGPHSPTVIRASLTERLALRDGSRRWTQILSWDTDHEADAPTDSSTMLMLGLVADVAGVAELAVTTAVDYVKDRHQFGVPVGTFQAVQHLCADASVASKLIDLTLDDAARTGDTAAVRRAVLQASRSIAIVAHNTVQAHGGIGFTAEGVVGRCARRLYASDQLLRAFGQPAEAYLEGVRVDLSSPIGRSA